MPLGKLFISHAASDKPLVEQFVRLVEGGIGVPAERIFCSSSTGQGIQPGKHFESVLREQLDQAAYVIALVSRNFYGSAYCMCELGGVWLRAKDFVPVLVPPLEMSDLRAVLAGVHAVRLDPAGLDELRDEIVSHLDIVKPERTPRWNERRDEFMKLLPGLLAKLPDETAVPRATYNKAVQREAEYKDEVERLQAELGKKDALVAELRNLKNVSEVTKVFAAHSGEQEAFEAYSRKAKSAVRDLPPAVREALYQQTRGEEYFPPREDLDMATRSVEDGQLRRNAHETGFEPCLDDSKVRKARVAVDELRDWLNLASSDFAEWYEEEYGGRPDITLRPFWKKQGYHP